MTNATKKSQHLEVLVSTMHKTSLTFLSKMFPEDTLSDLSLLVVNQTNEEQLLTSNNKSIKVINSFKKGLSQSRNEALNNATESICLIADDDVCYVKNFKEIILSAFNKYEDADIITFQMTDDEGQLFRDYQDIIKHTKKTIYTANSVVIAFRLESVRNIISFNPNFGLGAKFQVADEFVLLQDAIKAGLKVFFEPKIILAHPKLSSGQDAGSDRVIYGRSALYYKYYGLRSYFRIVKHIYRTFKNGNLSLTEIIPKYKIALKGIADYKKLVKLGLEIR